MQQSSQAKPFAAQPTQSRQPIQRAGTGEQSSQSGDSEKFIPVDLDELEKLIYETGESSSSSSKTDSTSEEGDDGKSEDSEESEYSQGADKGETYEEEILGTTFAHKKIETLWNLSTTLEEAIESEDHKKFNTACETVNAELSGLRKYLAHHPYYFETTRDELSEEFLIISTFLTYIIEDGIEEIPDNEKPLPDDKKDKENEKYRDLINFRKSLIDTSWQPSQDSWQSSLSAKIEKGKDAKDAYTGVKTVSEGKGGIDEKAGEQAAKVKTANGVRSQLNRCSVAYNNLKNIKLQDVEVSELNFAIEECSDALNELSDAVGVLSALPGVAIVFNAIALIKDMIEFYRAAKRKKELQSQKDLSAKDKELSKALEQAASDKLKVLSFDTGIQLTKIAGNIVVLTGAGAPIGFSMSVGASAAKATAKGVQRLVQIARDKKLPFANKEKTTEKINARASSRADAVLEKIRDLPDAIRTDKDIGLYLSAQIFYDGAGGSMKAIKGKSNMSEEDIKKIRNNMGKYLATAHKL